jgi:DnaJ family protein B protein 4
MRPQSSCGTSFTGSTSYGGNACKFDPRTAEDIFAEFFSCGSDHFSAGRGRGRHLGGHFGGVDGLFRSFNDTGSCPKRAVSPVENKLLCTLEELYTGSTRKVKISRNITDAFG